MAKVTVKRTRKIKVEPSPAVRAMAAEVVAHHKERLRRGIDRAGAQMPARSSLYLQQLAAIGKSGTPVGVLTGGLAESIILTRVRGQGLRQVMVFGADGKSSPIVERPPWWCFDPKKTQEQRTRALLVWRRFRHAKQKRQSHKKALRWLVGGYRGRTSRRAMGITPQARAQILRAMQQAGIFRS